MLKLDKLYIFYLFDFVLVRIKINYDMDIKESHFMYSDHSNHLSSTFKMIKQDYNLISFPSSCPKL